MRVNFYLILELLHFSDSCSVLTTALYILLSHACVISFIFWVVTFRIKEISCIVHLSGLKLVHCNVIVTIIITVCVYIENILHVLIGIRTKAKYRYSCIN